MDRGRQYPLTFYPDKQVCAVTLIRTHDLGVNLLTPVSNRVKLAGVEGFEPP